LNTETSGMPAALALARAFWTSAGGTASSTIPSTLAATASWIALFHTEGSLLPSTVRTFQPSCLPASAAPAAARTQPMPCEPQVTTTTCLPGCTLTGVLGPGHEARGFSAAATRWATSGATAPSAALAAGVLVLELEEAESPEPQPASTPTATTAAAETVHRPRRICRCIGLPLLA